MRLVAKWNPARDVWEVPDTENLLCEHLDVFSETFPLSGMTRAGTAYAQPMSERRTDDSASSLSLPTPRATRGESNTETVALLPTPDAYSADRGGPQDPAKRKAGGHSVTLADVTSIL